MSTGREGKGDREGDRKRSLVLVVSQMKMLKLSGTKCDKKRLAKNMSRGNEEQQRSITLHEIRMTGYTLAGSYILRLFLKS